MGSVRQPCVAGTFYPSNAAGLLSTLDEYIKTDTAPRHAVAAIMPHAGYLYSGATAGIVAGSLHVPTRVVLLGPKHTHDGAACAVSDADSWRTPIGDIPVDRTFARFLCESPLLNLDDDAHRGEHSLEVIVPFLWRRNPSLSIVPVALHTHRLENLRQIAQHLARGVRDATGTTLIVASSDMSHQISAAQANELDHLAIGQILSMDAEGLLRVVGENRISMCGVVPTTVALLAAKALGATHARLLSYTHSGMVTGDSEKVVGYAGIAITGPANADF